MTVITPLMAQVSKQGVLLCFTFLLAPFLRMHVAHRCACTKPAAGASEADEADKNRCIKRLPTSLLFSFLSCRCVSLSPAFSHARTLSIAPPHPASFIDYLIVGAGFSIFLVNPPHKRGFGFFYVFIFFLKSTRRTRNQKIMVGFLYCLCVNEFQSLIRFLLWEIK